MNTTRLRGLLRDHYQPPEWFLSFEVQAERDEGGLRFADAVAFNTRKTSGNLLMGFELKVSRSDWLNEVRNPEKAMAARALCDHWVIVAAPGVVSLTELPLGVGLLIAKEHGLHTARVPSKQRQPLGVVDRRIIAALLIRHDPLEPRTYWEAQVHAAEAKGYAKGRNAAGRSARARDRSGLKQGPDGPLDLP